MRLFLRCPFMGAVCNDRTTSRIIDRHDAIKPGCPQGQHSGADTGRGSGQLDWSGHAQNVRSGPGTGCSSWAGFIQPTDPGAQMRGHPDTGASAEAQAPPPDGGLPAALTVMGEARCTGSCAG